MSRVSRRDRIEAIVDFLASHPNIPYTVAEVAEGVGRDYTERFGDDLSAARHLAREGGDLITACARIPGHPQRCLVYTPRGSEKGQGGPGLDARARDCTTRVRNLKDNAEFQIENAVLPWDRLLAQADAAAAGAFLSMAQTRTAIEAAIRSGRPSA
jgi:hypothetical protein